MKKLYYSEHHSPGGNEKTQELRAFFNRVKERKPNVIACASFDPFQDDPRIKAIRFSALPYEGRVPTVFAYIGFPEGAGDQSPVPGMVLVHGGGGHAYAEWVRDWVDRGFAAISFDGFCQTYTGPEHTYDASLEFWAEDPDAYPPMACFISGKTPIDQQGFTYYTADILLANSLLRSDMRVNKDQIGLTDISWGGFSGSLAACYDDRFAFAAPVYGCGFQDVSHTPWGQVFREDGVTEQWDAKHLLGEVKMPIHFFNSDSDPFFDANSTTASACAVPNGAMTLLPGFTHGQTEGSTIPELFRFAETQVGRRERNIEIHAISTEKDGAALSFTRPQDVCQTRVCVYYKTEELLYEEKYLKEEWRCEQREASDGRAWLPIPAQAQLFYFSVEGKTTAGQTLHASSGVYSRRSWNAAEIDPD